MNRDIASLSSDIFGIVRPDYQAAYSALARRVAAAYAYQVNGNHAASRTELEAAMQVIEAAENPLAVIQCSSSD